MTECKHESKLIVTGHLWALGPQSRVLAWCRTCGALQVMVLVEFDLSDLAPEAQGKGLGRVPQWQNPNNKQGT